MLTRFPFDGLRCEKIRAHLATEFPHLLGPTNPRPSTVRVEPFPTSVFKVPT